MTESETLKEVNPEQSLKAESLIELTPLPIETNVNPLQPSNAEEPISVMKSGILSCPVTPEQP